MLRFHKFSITAKIIGDGEQISNLKSICQSDNLLFDNVQFYGSLDESELAIHYQKADIFYFVQSTRVRLMLLWKQCPMV